MNIYKNDVHPHPRKTISSKILALLGPLVGNYDLTVNMIRNIDRVFYNIPSVTFPMTVYRCYGTGIYVSQTENTKLEESFKYFQYLSTSYNYNLANGWCKGSPAKSILAAIHNGPLSIAIEADQQSFQFYSGGIYSDVGCGTKLDHGVNLVGYGSENGKDYWILRNSWGTTWGENGYMRILRGKNICGLSQMPSMPVV